MAPIEVVHSEPIADSPTLEQDQPMPDFQSSQLPTDAGLTFHLERLHDDVGDMKEALKELAASVSRLALVEERLGNTNQALERLFKAVEKLEVRVTAEENKTAAQAVTTAVQTVTSTRTSEWVDKGIWAALAGLGTYALTHIGFIK